MGSDVGLEESVRLSLCGLVGRFTYHALSFDSLPEWLLDNWLPILGYVSELISLSFGWFGFIFNTPEDLQLILDTFWTMGSGSIMLKRWRVSFNPSTDSFCFRHVWVLLLRLPLPGREGTGGHR
jgi:hypothetical protein